MQRARQRRFGYVRANESDEQSRQIAALLADGVPRDAIFTDTLDDTPHRARLGFTALRRRVAPGDSVSVWRLDRLGRTVTEVLNTFDGLHQAGIALRAIADGLDSHTAAGRLACGVLSGLAGYARTLRVAVAHANRHSAPPRSRGRKRVMTPERASRAVQLLGAGQHADVVARMIGVSRSTLYTAIRGDLAAQLAALPGGWRRCPPGRRPTMSADRVTTAVALIADGLTPAAVAASIGVSRTTLYGALRQRRAALAADDEGRR